jgi:NADPH-dependent glutamate synthase beta subunit-like oxidoreductase/NAD(P)H-flavin reductase
MDAEAALAATAKTGAAAIPEALATRVHAAREAHAAASAGAATGGSPSAGATGGPGEPGDPGTDAAFVAKTLTALETWCAARAHSHAKSDVRGWVSFHFPENMHYESLVATNRPEPAELPERRIGPEDRLRRRDGFALTDPRMTRREVLSEVAYCIYCHGRDKDSCSKGLHAKEGGFKKNPLGILLEGCPLDEKISEAHTLEKDGDTIAALAIVALDNPMCPGTGHRICNDCMKSCIFQVQEPVNIPQIETGVLTDVLRLPWGVEIYGFLTRWNPLNVRRPYALPYNGKNVLVVGMGPAGYTLAHHLLNEGFGVVGIDGLKIEPLPVEMTGDPGAGVPPHPIASWESIYRTLDSRVLEGFGGVSEYGITVRWDKNFLTLIHLTLARREKLRIFGGVRFGGTLTAEDAWALGFDHIAIAAGAGRPTIVEMKNNLSRGIRKASDFLMALQLTGAAKKDTLANLQARLPAVVIGGGLTAIDTATELAAYYPRQVEKMLHRYEEIAAKEGGDRVWRALDQEETEILREFLDHGRAVREERKRAAAAGEAPDFVPLVRSWGGVSIAYRKSMEDSPAYRLNHEEVIKALEEGISFIERMEPDEALLDRYGAVHALRCKTQEQKDGKWVTCERTVTLPARSVMVAAGTSPNVIYEREHPGTFQLDGKARFFSGHHAVRGADGRFHPVGAKSGERAFFTSYDDGGRLISFYGDNHPVYAGNVVKAMASAKDGFPAVAGLFAEDIARLSPDAQPAREKAFAAFAGALGEQLTARVHAVVRLTPTIVEVIVKAPLAARKFHPGQFYRLQNYETLSPLVGDTRLMMEGLALTGAWTDPEKGLLSLIVLEMGASSRLCVTLQPNDPVVVMGPTGTPTEIPRGESVLLAGGGLGNAVLFSIARAMREAGNRVLYFAGYKKGEDIFKREEIEAGCDQIIWSTDSGAEIVPSRPQDSHFRGNIVQAIKTYGDGQLGDPLIPLPAVDRIIAIGSDRMMNAVKEARRAVLAPYLKKDHVAIGSINSPMQCMMKEVCAQCLQKHVDPVTGAETAPVFSCFNQDQKLDEVDFQNLAVRLKMNSVQEKLANLWLDHILAKAAAPAP